jgi:hypothetical protein
MSILRRLTGEWDGKKIDIDNRVVEIIVGVFLGLAMLAYAICKGIASIFKEKKKGKV